MNWDLRDAMPNFCQHTLIEFEGCEPALLERARDVKRALVAAVLAGRGTIVKTVFHNFSPHGVSGVVVITESHVTVHTWPERGYAAVDVFSCSTGLDHAAIRKALRLALGAKRVRRRSFARGPEF